MHARWEATLPNIQPFYAVKCNDDMMLLKTLAALGTGFDCASKVLLYYMSEDCILSYYFMTTRMRSR